MGKYAKQDIANSRNRNNNSPRDSVTWYQSTAFCNWLNYKLSGHTLLVSESIQYVIGINAVVRLPREWEWAWVSQGGSELRPYSFGEWNAASSNTSEADLDRSIAVGMYPMGDALCGASDMVGNVYEWCSNKYEYPEQFDVDISDEERSLKGGCYFLGRNNALCAVRFSYRPYLGEPYFGFRPVVDLK